MHPSRDVLNQYLTGQLPDAEAESVDEHLADCTACDDTIQSLRPDPDTIVDGLRGGPPDDPIANEPACREMVQRIQKLDASASGAGGSQGPTVDSVNPSGPNVLREYRLLDKLGEGGMGAVYKALHTRLDRIVAVKVLSAHRLADAAAIARFDREMKAVGKLEHPNIIRAMDAGEVDGMHYLVMEFVDGIDLDRLVRERGPLPVAEACEVIRQAAIGLQHAADRGIIHRDLKPSNLILCRAGRDDSRVRILDLGLALLEQPSSGAAAAAELTGTGQLMGTVDYMAPEQGQDTHRVDIRADVYSLGATLYKLLTGRAPFGGAEYDTLMKKLVALAGEAPREIRTLRPEIPPALAELIHRMLSKRPEDRPSSPAGVAAEIGPFAARADLAGLLDEPDAAAPADQSMSRDTLPDIQETFSRSRRASTGSGSRRHLDWRIVAAGLAAALVLAVVVFQFATQDGTVIVRLESEQPVTSIKVDGREVEWTLAGDSRAFRFQIAPGPVSTIVLTTEDGTEIAAEIPADGLTIERGEDYRLTAAVEDSGQRADDVAAVAATDPERRVIDWVRSIGGRVGGGNPQLGFVTLDADDPIPAGPFDLVTVGLEACDVRDEDLSLLDELPHLTTLTLNHTSVSDAGLALLGNLPQLRNVYLVRTRITDAGLRELERYAGLGALHIDDAQITDAGLASVAAWSGLTQLHLSNTNVTDACIPSLSSLKRLTQLHVRITGLSPDGVNALRAALPQCLIRSNFGEFAPAAPLSPDQTPDRAVAEWAHAIGGVVGLGGVRGHGYLTIRPDDALPDGSFDLIVLDVSGCPVTDADMARLDGLKLFSTLIMNGTPVTDAGFADIGDLPKLMAVYVGGTGMTDDGLRRFVERFPHVRALHAGGTQITAAGVPALLDWENLLELRLENPAISDAALQTLSEARYLRTLHLAATGVTRDGIEQLHDAKPHMAIVSDKVTYPEPPIEGAASLRFNGVNAAVNIPTLTYDTSHPITIEASVRREPPLDEYACVVTNSMTVDGPPSATLSWHDRDKGWHFGVYTGDRAAAAFRETNPRPTHIAGVWDGARLLLFFDGKLISHREYSATPFDADKFGHFVIGAMQTLGGDHRMQFFGGVIDEVRISRIARYDSDYEVVPRLETDEHTLALYHFDEGEGDIAHDASGHGHDGNIVNATWIRSESR